ncbi:MFS transporter [Saccharolobus islandicus]|uniref:Major facilitator superfamily MFS_1 n=2 Tax=Saccharolobus islandicus TaxID=43080 RepID=F0ND96_SACI5|nr:MFS transporter [Sulfolobus islandicus]ADX83733.1 major facilitator superfamily MFS_1 [Sulfolobus islandicus HVE10/4]ADX86393.1 major facilitator superfamily MFS_1 [Sulfolobus islandicus REY15A]WCM37545.1 MFS transporter [Sulfolobus islandicus]
MKEINRIAIIGGVRSFSGSIIWPFIGFALYKLYGFSLDTVSIFYLIQAFLNVIASISGGIVVDYIGRRNAMVLSMIVSSLALFTAYLVNLPIPIAGLILLQTFFNTIYNISSTAIVGDIYKRADLVKAFSRQRVGINAGWALGPLIGGYIFTFYGFKTLLLVSSLIAIIPIPLVRLLPEFKGGGNILNFNVNNQFILFLISTFLTFVLVGQLGFGLLTYYNAQLHFTEFQVSILFAINGIMIVALQDLVGRLISKRLWLIVIGTLIYASGYFGVAFITNFLVASIDIVIITIAEMIVTPLSQAIANSLTNQSSRGRQIGLYSMVTGIGRVSGSSLVSELMNYYLYTPVILWGIMASFGLVSATIYLYQIKRIKI